MDNELITVIIVVNNLTKMEEFKRAIESVYSQKDYSAEIIIVENLINTWYKKLSDLSLLSELKRNNLDLFPWYRGFGLIRCLKSITSIAKGEYICFLNASDYFLPYKLKYQLEIFFNNHQVDICYSDAYIINSSGRVYEYWDTSNSSSYGIPFSSLMIKKESCIRINFQKLLKNFNSKKYKMARVKFATVKVTTQSASNYIRKYTNNINQQIKKKYLTGKLLLNKRNYTQALKYFQDVTECAPNIHYDRKYSCLLPKVIDSYFKRAICHFYLGEYKNAILLTTAIIENIGVRKPKVYYLLSTCFREIGWEITGKGIIRIMLSWNKFNIVAYLYFLFYYIYKKMKKFVDDERSTKVNILQVKKFWEENPLCASKIKYPPGSVEFFREYDKLKEENEPISFQERVYEYSKFEGKKVLDVGCGNGYMLSKYASRGAEVVGVDLTYKAIEITKKRFEMLNLKGEFLVANAEQLPFKESKFDLVTSMGVIHQTPKTEDAVNEIYRVLKPNGKFIGMVYYKHSFLYSVIFPLRIKFSKKYRGLTKGDLINRVDGEGNPLGKVYSKSDMRKLLRNFKNIHMEIAYLPAHQLPKIGRFWTGNLVPKPLLQLLSKVVGFFLFVKGYK